MNALVSIECAHAGLSEARAAALARFCAQKLGLPDPAEVSITFVSDDDMAHLNERHRGKIGPTDVLSFECDNLDDGFPEDGEVFEAGDIIVAPKVACRQAEELGHTFTEEVDTLLVHGILHLLGYDHIEDADAEEMQTAQDALLAAWWATTEGAVHAR